MTVMDQNDSYSMRQWINGHFGKSKMTVFQKTKNNGHFGAKLTVILNKGHFGSHSFLGESPNKGPSSTVSKNKKKLPTHFSHTLKPQEHDGKHPFSKY